MFTVASSLRMRAVDDLKVMKFLTFNFSESVFSGRVAAVFIGHRHEKGQQCGQDLHCLSPFGPCPRIVCRIGPYAHGIQDRLFIAKHVRQYPDTESGHIFWGKLSLAEFLLLSLLSNLHNYLI